VSDDKHLSCGNQECFDEVKYYYFDLDKWLEEHGAHPFANREHRFRNVEWFHMVNEDIISMPDKWEYPLCRMGSRISPSR
jgi:hypothetical protein